MKIAVAMVHGIGRQDKSYADDFIKELKKHYQKLTGNVNLVCESICWQEEIEPIEQQLFEKLQKLGWDRLRGWFIGYIGDALCYQPSPNDDYGFYNIVHKAIDQGLTRLYKSVDPESPLCIISHSLGTVVISNFIWDVQHGCNTYQPSKEARAMVDRLELLYTMASPLAVWSMRFPGGGTPITIRNTGLWYNLYSHNDIIGSPIKIINQQYECMPNLFDVLIKVGGILSSWNPTSHSDYWDSKKVVSHIAINLKRVNDYYQSRENSNAKS